MTNGEEWENLMQAVIACYGKGEYLAGILNGEAALKLAEDL
jgi:hypothetical protein